MVKSVTWQAAKDFCVVCALGAGLALMAAGAPASPNLDQDTGVTVHFGFDAVDLDAQARQALDAEAAWMRGHRGMTFNVFGHADRVGSEAYNRELALRRALTVASYLVARGVDPDRLQALVSWGEEQPVVDTDQPSAPNRRVVISLATPGADKDTAFTLAEGGADRGGRVRPEPASGSDGDDDTRPSAAEGPSSEDQPSEPGTATSSSRCPANASESTSSDCTSTSSTRCPSTHASVEKLVSSSTTIASSRMCLRADR